MKNNPNKERLMLINWKFKILNSIGIHSFVVEHWGNYDFFIRQVYVFLTDGNS